MLDLQIPDVSVSDNLNDGFFIREGGLNIRSNLSDGVQAYRNSLVLILQILQLENRRLLLPHQVHGKEALVVNSPNVEDYLDQAQSELSIEADTIITNVPRIGVGIITAGCVPMANPFGLDWPESWFHSVEYRQIECTLPVQEKTSC